MNYSDKQTLKIPILQQSETSAVQYDSECSSVGLPMTPSDLSTSVTTKIPMYLSDQKDTVTLSEIESSMDDIPFDDLICDMMKDSKCINEDILFKKHGYKIEHKICDTLQGEIYKAKATKLFSDSVAIKKTDKDLWRNKIAMQDDMSFCVEEDIVKEACILKHLTVDNIPAGNYIVQFIELFESDTHYYLVMEYVENGMNLKKFVQIAQDLIKQRKLKFKEYSKTIKYIMWQLMATVRWMHDVLSCCHLDLCLENIMLKNANFIEGKNGFLKVNNALSVRLCDFGVAELYDAKIFDCWKNGLTLDNGPYVSPQIYQNDKYDARAADMWSIGIIMYECFVGESLYEAKDMWDEAQNGYLALKTNTLVRYLATNNLLKYFPGAALPLLSKLLKINESKRLTATQMIQHDFFKAYYTKYYKRIQKKIAVDTQNLQERSEYMSTFPYYKC